MVDRGALGAYLHLLAAQSRGQAQYRLSFAVDVVGSFLFAFADLAGVLALFQVTRTLGGFDLITALLMASVSGVGFAMADLAVGNVERLRAYIRTGLLDTVLIRPLSPLGQLVVRDFAPRRIGRVIVTAGVLGVCLARSGLHPTPATVALLVLASLSAAALFGAIFVAGATVAFWWIDSGEFASALTYGGREFSAYPLTVYATGMRWLFGYGVGFGFAGYYPVLTLLGRDDPLGLPRWTGWCSPLVAAIAVALAGLVWRTGVRHYRSTGS